MRSESTLATRKEALAKAELLAKMDAEAVDITLPGRGQQVGTRHLISGIIDEISDIFLRHIPWLQTGPLKPTTTTSKL